jgi:hypothetical protein
MARIYMICLGNLLGEALSQGFGPAGRRLPLMSLFSTWFAARPPPPRIRSPEPPPEASVCPIARAAEIAGRGGRVKGGAAGELRERTLDAVEQPATISSRWGSVLPNRHPPETRKGPFRAFAAALTFMEAVRAFLDPFAVDLPDAAHPDRLVRIGMTLPERLLYVVYTEKTPSGRLRVITARRATRHEQKNYEER